MLITTSDGDLRKAITSLQSAYRLKGQKQILKQDICEISSVRVLYIKSRSSNFWKGGNDWWIRFL